MEIFNFTCQTTLLLWNEGLKDITDIKKNHIFINSTNMEYDKKEIAFFQKAHIYWDVWKYIILPVRLLIPLEFMTKCYYFL